MVCCGLLNWFCWFVVVFWRFGDLLIVWLFDCFVVCLVGSLVGWFFFVLFCLVLFVASLQLDRWPGEKACKEKFC